MKCPIDNVELVMADRQGIEIDYCPKCRGVWLDRGELDKIIERSVPPEPQRQPQQFAERRPDQSYEGRDYRDDDYRRKPYKKRESFLSDIFDF
jgi:Zn-finger nucleic acid-binding protein